MHIHSCSNLPWIKRNIISQITVLMCNSSNKKIHHHKCIYRSLQNNIWVDIFVSSLCGQQTQLVFTCKLYLGKVQLLFFCWCLIAKPYTTTIQILLMWKMLARAVKKCFVVQNLQMYTFLYPTYKTPDNNCYNLIDISNFGKNLIPFFCLIWIISYISCHSHTWFTFGCRIWVDIFVSSRPASCLALLAKSW